MNLDVAATWVDAKKVDQAAPETGSTYVTEFKIRSCECYARTGHVVTYIGLTLLPTASFYQCRVGPNKGTSQRCIVVIDSPRPLPPPNRSIHAAIKTKLLAAAARAATIATFRGFTAVDALRRVDRHMSMEGRFEDRVYNPPLLSDRSR